MFDRSTYLADQLLKRRRLLEASLALDGAPWDEAERQREELVARILVFEAGTGDPEAVRMVLAAMPTYSPDEKFSDWECEEFERFLRNALVC